MFTADGVPDRTSFSSTAKALRARAALVDYLNSPAAADLEAAAPGAALVSIGAIRSQLAAHAGLLRRFGAHDADGYALSSSCLAALGQDGPP